MQSNEAQPPAINAPAVVVWFLAVLIGVHAVRQFIGAAGEEHVISYLALYPFRLGPDGGSVIGGFWIGVSSLATHALLHSDWLHLLINGAWLLAFGSLIARRTSVAGFAVLFVVCAIAGGLFFIGINGFSQAIVIGASGAISGLMGAAFRLIFAAYQGGGMALLQRYPKLVPRMSLAMALRDRATMVASGLWVLFNLLFGLGGPMLVGAASIAWEAHLGGFLAGFVLFGVVDQGRCWS